MRRIYILLTVTVILALPSFQVKGTGNQPLVASLQLEGTVTPVQAEYIQRGLREAETANADLVIINMDTPGGLDNAMRDIIQSITTSKVPVAVYVIPGGRAASAGFFITLAADVACMAPNTAIGAATPIALGQGSQAEPADDVKNKILNDAIAYARALSEERDRNADWAELAVKQGASISASSALDMKVIDIVATSQIDLLKQLNGFEVTRPDGSLSTLQTAEARIISIEMTFMEGLLLALSNPDIAYILLSLAILGITVELFNPGLIFPGVTGAICGLMAFYSLGVLPVNYTGILLMVLAIVLFIAEAYTPAFGLLTAGGIVSLATGSLILFKGGPLFSVNPWLITTVVLVITVFLLFVIHKVVTAHRHQPTTGSEDLKGKEVPVHTALQPHGTVLYEGEIWKAFLDEGTAEPGETVVITGWQGLTLFVTKDNKGGS